MSVSLPIRLLAIDIDGTLLNSQFEIPTENLSMLRRVHEAGVQVVLVTGRRHTFALPIAQLLGFEAALISSNGAVTRSSQGELFHRDLLPLSTARVLIEHMRQFRGNTVLTFDKETKGALVLECMDELGLSIQRWLEKNMNFIDFVVPIEDALIEDPVQAMFCGSISRMNVALERLATAPFADRITVLRTEYPLRDLCIVDILNRNCSKGHALERWAGHLGIAREQVMAIGDNYNDVEMLAFAGVPVIMGNACEDLRGRGWTVTQTHDNAGVACALEQLLGNASAKP
jgi:Cof subfamily protein (haloacid dehalogenase superfamily)